MGGFRYLAYLAFAFVAIIFWGFLLLLRSLGDPVCEPYPCPPPSWLSHVFAILIIWGSMPLTVLLFIPYRLFIRKLLNVADE
jgi:hypothetical protein